jgi:ribosomal protein S18 acetylase RimI-like enzyme
VKACVAALRIQWFKPTVQAKAIIRRAGPQDLERAAFLGAQIVRLHHSVDPKRFFLPDDVEQGYAWWLGQEISRDEAVVMVAELDGEIVGYCYGAIEDRDWGILIDRHGVVHDVYVAEPARRKGIARTLVTTVMNELEAMGVSILKVSIMVQNESAQRLVQSLGFKNTMLEFTRVRA